MAHAPAARNTTAPRAATAEETSETLPTSVTLDVGGVIYEVEDAQILGRVAGSMLETMFLSRRWAVRHDPAGRVRLEGHGPSFEHVLAFLADEDRARAAREARKTLFGLDAEGRARLRSELDFFGLEDAVFPWYEAGPRPTWARGPQMPSGREGCGAFVSTNEDGARVVVVLGGGDGEKITASTSVMEARPSGVVEALAWRAGPDMVEARSGAAVVALGEGRAMVLGGYREGADREGVFVASTEIFDGAKFAAGPRMLLARVSAAAAKLNDGRVVVCGGWGSGKAQASTEVLDADGKTFVAGPPMLSPRRGAAAVALDDGRVLVLGGEDEDAQPLATTELLDADATTWTPGPRLAGARADAQAVLLDAHAVLLVGGQVRGDQLNTTELIDVDVLGDATVGPNLVRARSSFGAVLDGTRVLVFGGWGGLGPDATTEVFASPATHHRPPLPTHAQVLRGVANAKKRDSDSDATPDAPTRALGGKRPRKWADIMNDPLVYPNCLTSLPRSDPLAARSIADPFPPALRLGHPSLPPAKF